MCVTAMGSYRGEKADLRVLADLRDLLPDNLQEEAELAQARKQPKLQPKKKRRYDVRLKPASSFCHLAQWRESKARTSIEKTQVRKAART
jgi:hypothetical protein